MQTDYLFHEIRGIRNLDKFSYLFIMKNNISFIIASKEKALCDNK